MPNHLSMKFNYHLEEEHLKMLEPKGWAWFGMKTEPNRTELFARFKITEPNYTEPNCTKPNRYYWYRLKNIKKKNKRNRILEVLKTKPNCFSSVRELLVMVRFFFGLVRFSSTIRFGFFIFGIV